ncbi:unnamed protein product, partial [marine sediment metagenome]
MDSRFRGNDKIRLIFINYFFYFGGGADGNGAFINY